SSRPRFVHRGMVFTCKPTRYPFEAIARLERMERSIGDAPNRAAVRRRCAVLAAQRSALDCPGVGRSYVSSSGWELIAGKAISRDSRTRTLSLPLTGRVNLVYSPQHCAMLVFLTGMKVIRRFTTGRNPIPGLPIVADESRRQNSRLISDGNVSRMRFPCRPHPRRMKAQCPPPNPTQPHPTPPNPTRRKPKASAGADAPSLPDWIPTDCWAGFLEMRRNIRAPVTNHAIKLLIDRLLELRNDGHDLGA